MAGRNFLSLGQQYIYQKVGALLSNLGELSGEKTLSNLFFIPVEKGSTLKGKNGSRLFPFRADLFQNWCVGRQTGSKKVASHVKMVTNLPNIYSSLKLQM